MLHIKKFEEGRYYVRLNTGGEYLVDINEFSGNGFCSCSDFAHRHLPYLQAQQEAGETISRKRCKHLRLLFYNLGSKSNNETPRQGKEVEEAVNPEVTNDTKEHVCNCNPCVCWDDDYCNQHSKTTHT